MHEDVLRTFFKGEASAAALARDLEGALVLDGPSMTRHPIVDMVGDFEVRPHHLGFCLVASDAFHWNGDSPEGGRVAEVAHDWASPEINYPLTVSNVAAWRR